MGIGISLAGGGGGSGSTEIISVANAAALPASAAVGLVLYYTADTKSYYFWNGSAWVLILDDADHADLQTVIAGLAAHLADTTDAHDASAISFDNTNSAYVTATDVQDWIEQYEATWDTNYNFFSDHIIGAAWHHAASVIDFTPVGTIAATDVQAAIAEVASEAATNLTAHLNDTSDAHDASAISVVPTGNISSSDVQTALQELQGDINTNATAISDHLADTTDAHDASAISFVAGGTVVATDVQAAIAEVASEANSRLTDLETSVTGGMAVSATQTLAAAATLTPANFRQLLVPVAGSGGAVTLTDLGVTSHVAGDVLMLVGTDDTNTVTLASATNTVMNGSCTLANNDVLSFVFYNSKWVETSRSN